MILAFLCRLLLNSASALDAPPDLPRPTHLTPHAPGNKCDCLPPPPHTLPEAELCRKILSVQEYVRLWAGEQGYMHLECSAKNDTGVEAAMMAMVASALEDVKRPRNHCNNQAEADNAGTNRAPAGSGRGSRAPAHARGSLAIDDLFAPEHSAGTCCR